MGEEKREEPDDFYTRAYKLLEDWARERGVLDEWKGELEKLARKKGQVTCQ